MKQNSFRPNLGIEHSLITDGYSRKRKMEPLQENFKWRGPLSKQAKFFWMG